MGQRFLLHEDLADGAVFVLQPSACRCDQLLAADEFHLQGENAEQQMTIGDVDSTSNAVQLASHPKELALQIAWIRS
jgi:hypothetical protein